MKWAVTAEEMRNIDSRTINKIGIPSTTLMERAGLEVINSCHELFENLTGLKTLIFCGKGNNGGDGFVIARELKRLDADVSVYILGKKSDLKGDALLNYNIIKQMNLDIIHISSIKQLEGITETADLVIDALLGTGFRGEVLGLYAAAIAKINSLVSTILSVDIPSGLNADTGTYFNECVDADITVTMGLLKRGLLLYPGKLKAGEVEIADIGFPTKAIAPEKVKTFLIEDTDIMLLLPQRMPYFHKGDCGKVLIIGGATGMTGAVSLTAQAALRSGAGMTLLGIPESMNNILEQKLTETMTLPLPQTSDGHLSKDAIDKILDAAEWADVLAIGPGIGRHKETIQLVLEVLRQSDKPAVIDADALYAVSKRTKILKDRKAPTIITPHQGEYHNLFPADVQKVTSGDKIESVRLNSKKMGSTILLKGSPTIIGSIASGIYINPTGNSGMATAGSGDVLTGIIAGLMAQGMETTYAGVAGAYIHGLAGDICASEIGERSMIAGDIVNYLPDAFESLFEEDDNIEY